MGNLLPSLCFLLSIHPQFILIYSCGHFINSLKCRKKLWKEWTRSGRS